MTTEVVRRETSEVARPLRVLVPLIQKDLKAAQEAGMECYRAAGEKLIEAKESFNSKDIRAGKFGIWAKRNFEISRQTANLYMRYAREAAVRGPLQPPISLQEHLRSEGRDTRKIRPPVWHEPVKQAVNRVNVEALNRERMERAKERALRKRLALQVVDIGFKALAQKLHPDRGGSKEAMARLSDVRKALKSAIEGLVHFQ